VLTRHCHFATYLFAQHYLVPKLHARRCVPRLLLPLCCLRSAYFALAPRASALPFRDAAFQRFYTMRCGGLTIVRSLPGCLRAPLHARYQSCQSTAFRQKSGAPVRLPRGRGPADEKRGLSTFCSTLHGCLWNNLLPGMVLPWFVNLFAHFSQNVARLAAVTRNSCLAWFWFA